MIKNTIVLFSEDPLFRNSIFLMLSTGVMAVLGFIFWLINAHLYSVTDIGIATTLISIMSLISTLSLFGFQTVYIRFLSNSKDPNREINTGLAIVTIAATIITITLLILLPWISPKLVFLRSSPLLAGSFIVFMIISALNMITDSVFIAQRSTHYNLVVNSAMSLTKVILPIFFLSIGAYGIFMAAAVGAVVDLILSFYFMVKKFDYHFQILIDMNIVRRTFHYFITNYASNVISLVPSLVLPIFILNKLGESSAAYYYIDMMIANILYVIPAATSQSLFAEGSYNEERLIGHIRRAVKINSLLLVPAVTILVLGGGLILRIYGKGYAYEGTAFLQLLAVSGVFIAINYTFSSIFKILRYKLGIILGAFAGTVSILTLSFLLVGNGLLGIGTAWVLGQGIGALAMIVAYYLTNSHTQSFLATNKA
jgi:O-antigen/teichoic acid export membrane protein